MTVPRYCAIRDLSFRFDKAVGREYLLREIVGASPPGEAEPRVDRLDDLFLRDLSLFKLLNHRLNAPLLLALGLGSEKEVRRFDFEAVGVHALPHIENLGLLVGLKVEPLLEEYLDLCQPLPGDLLVRRDDDDVVHVPSVEFSTEEADAILVELVEVDVGEVLGADIPEGYAGLAFRARVDHFAKKPVEPKEVLVLVGVLLFELLEPLRDDLL